MKLFKSPDNKVFAYEEDGSQDHIIPDNFVSITQAEADVLIAQNQQSDFDSLNYSEKRALEYPDFKIYLDGIVKGDQAQIQSYIDACKAVKEKYPKS